MMRSLVVLTVAMIMAAHGVCAEKKTAAAVKKKAAAAVEKSKSTVVNDDLYIEIKAHEAAFLAAALTDKQNLLTGTNEQKMEFAKLAQEKKGECDELRKKLLAERNIKEQDFNAYESALTSETMSHLKTQFKGMDLKNLKFDDKNGFNQRAQNIAQGIAKRAGELEAKYK
jgi:hypothetical protein